MKNKEYSARILVIDDDFAVCTSLRLLLKKAGYQVHAEHYPKDALAYLSGERPDLILLDMNFSIDTSGRKGLEVLGEIRALHPHVPVILITGWGTLQLAVTGMKAGASDFLTKPWENPELLRAVRTALALKETQASPETPSDAFDAIIGQDPALNQVLEQAKRISQTDAPVLILGESGTGKELLAEAIHTASGRAGEPFVKVNLGGISASLFESEMFGHKKGAFTDAHADRTGRFALADRGSIFLDEIGDLDPSSQVKLLRVLQEKTFEPLGSSQTQRVDFRIISATNKDLVQAVSEQTFREDLLYRINLISLTLPPLRQRPNDIPLLAQHFMQTVSRLYGTGVLQAEAEALEWLKRQPFHGNIRELKNLVERTVLLAGKERLTRSDFEQHLTPGAMQASDGIPAVGSMTLADMEKQMVEKALEHHQNNIQQAARSLGITRSALYRRMQKYGLTDEA